MRRGLVVSEVMRHRGEGYEVLKRLRDDESLGGTPVICLTAKGMTIDRTQGYQAGVDDYIPKPFDPEELVARNTNSNVSLRCTSNGVPTN